MSGSLDSTDLYTSSGTIRSENDGYCKNKKSASISDAVIAARELVCPEPKARHTHECDYKYYQFWEKNDKLIKQAWSDYPSKHDELKYFNSQNEQLFIQKPFLDAVRAVKEGKHDEATLKHFLTEPVPGVFRTNEIFTPTFLNMMLEEIDHKNNAGIPLQRPNSMNRFGVILKVKYIENICCSLP